MRQQTCPLSSQHCHFPLLIINSVCCLSAQPLLLFCDLRAPVHNAVWTITAPPTLALLKHYETIYLSEFEYILYLLSVVMYYLS